ncbi:MAG: LytTR family DNA-binding domain-containing protein [Thermoanaerobaculia bacterium]|nr:LytTR family DNA-binding domain-containing protein [Thermoanaerobaculia bacterium]
MADGAELTRGLRVLVADDEPPARRRLLELLRCRSEVAAPVAEAADGRQAVERIAAGRPDLVFLDIQMPELDGFEVIEKVGPERMPAVVFVTAYDEYALDAFEVAAVDYLLKPFEDERFETAFRRSVESLRQRRSQEIWERLACLVDGRRLTREATPRDEPARPLERLPVERRGRTFLIPVRDVEWIAAEGAYVRLHTPGGRGPRSHLVRDSLKRLETVLDPERFVRVHRSAMVQAPRVRELRPLFHGELELVLESGATVKLSRSYRDRIDRLLR